MAIPPLAARPAVSSMGVSEEGALGQWFAWYVCAFLLGAAVGGFLFGRLGDRLGRARALGLSVLTYALVAGGCYFCTSAEQLLVLWFVACTGVGGVWPNGVSLVAEAFPGASRPWIAGVFGTAANLGLMLLALLAVWRPITPSDWRWVMLVCASPALLGIFIVNWVPESPIWLERRLQTLAGAAPPAARSIFRPPLLKLTLVGIALGTVPQMGNWGSSNWLVPWANQVQEQAGNRQLSAWTQWTKSSGAAIGSLLGGWFASRCGRRAAYFLISLLALGSSAYIFNFLTPLDDSFLSWVFVQGFVGTLYFGWLPLYLPELFPTDVRAAGTGVSFNWGRVLTALGVLAAGHLIRTFGGDYARVGQVTCLVYAVGLLIVAFAPDTSRKRLEE